MDLWVIMVITGIVAAFVSALLGYAVVPWLRKLKFGQTILEIGPKWHKEKKQGTPTMGGIMFIIGAVVAYTFCFVMMYLNGYVSFDTTGQLASFESISGMIMAVMFGFVGFVDDYIKVAKKRNEGLTEKQKLLLQTLIVAAYFTARIMSGNTSTVIRFPFIGQLDLWYFYYIIMGLGMIYIVNAVNLTDGIDGLCSSVSFVYCLSFVFITAILRDYGQSAIAVAAVGGCIGFLFWNFPPAKVFMGDTGSLFLGGIVVALGLGTGAEVLMVIAAAVFIWEALTVLIQTTYFKITKGKRLFKMTPIHHSFELRGWSEVKIDAVFSLIALAAGGVAVLLATGL